MHVISPRLPGGRDHGSRAATLSSSVVEAHAPDPFELVGHFGGFAFTAGGKRRLLLRRRGEPDRWLKVPKDLRRRVAGRFRPGEPIRVAGTAERDPVTGLIKYVVSRVLPVTGANVDAGAHGDTSPAVAALRLPPTHAAARPTTTTTTIRVCAKKNCWRHGGRELWEALDRELGARDDLTGRIELRRVGCLGRCKRAPNADCGRHEHTACPPHDASAIVAHAAKTQLSVVTPRRT